VLPRPPLLPLEEEAEDLGGPGEVLDDHLRHEGPEVVGHGGGGGK